MRERTYAVYWNEPDGPRYAGRMAFGPSFVELSGAAGRDYRSLHRILFDELASARLERGRLRLERHVGMPLEIGSADRPGALREVADRVRAALERDADEKMTTDQEVRP